MPPRKKKTTATTKKVAAAAVVHDDEETHADEEVAHALAVIADLAHAAENQAAPDPGIDEDDDPEENPNNPVAKRKKFLTHFTDEQEQSMVDWLRDNPVLYNK